MGRRVIYLGNPNTIPAAATLSGGTGFAHLIYIHVTLTPSNHHT
jgi:hypothetical protein